LTSLKALAYVRVIYVIRLQGITGEVILDMQGDREPDYWITDMAPDGTFIKIQEVLNFGVDRRVSCVPAV